MIIDFNRYNGGGSGSGVTPQEVQAQIDSALTPYWESGETKDYVDGAVSGIDLSNYYTSAQTDEKIASAVTPVANHLEEVEQVTASALTELHDGLLEVSAATSGKADAANVTANTDGFRFPKWNKQGIITGVSQQVSKSYLDVNDGDAGVYFFMNTTKYDTQNKALKLYTPLSAGTAGDILVSTGNGAPVWSAVTMPEVKTVIDFDHTSQSERASIYAELRALYDAGSGATINRNYDFYKTVNTWQGLKIDYYSFSGGSLVFGKVVSPENLTDQIVYEQVMSIDAAGNVAVATNSVGGGGGDMSGYWNSAETKSYVDSAATNFQDQIDTMDEVVSAALVDLEGKKVESQDVKHMVKLTQAQYDALVNKDPYTFYIIVSN